MKFTLFVLRVSDLERSRAFYAALGMTLVHEQHGNGPRHYSATLGDSVFEIYPGEPMTGLRLGFAIHDLEGKVNAAVAAGGQLLSPTRRINERLACVVADPDGHKLELTEDNTSLPQAR